jgi:RecJ-like exonuclease
MSEMVKCKKCDGLGFISDQDLSNQKTCRKCKGVGKINWLENVFDKKEITHEEQKIVHYNESYYKFKLGIRKDLKEKLEKLNLVFKNE